jgi:hypothetical protein
MENRKRQAKYNKSSLILYEEELKATKKFFSFLIRAMEEYGINPKKLKEENETKGISGKITSADNLFLNFKKNPTVFDNKET